jgi:hypothetical protein
MQFRTVLRIVMAFCLASCILAGLADRVDAQQPKKRAVANIPFEFFVGSHQLPSGRYQISMTSSSVFVLNNLENKANAQMFTLPEGPPVEAKDSKLIFFLHDGKWLLAGLAGPNGKERLSMYLGMSAGKRDVREDVPVQFESLPQ